MEIINSFRSDVDADMLDIQNLLNDFYNAPQEQKTPLYDVATTKIKASFSKIETTLTSIKNSKFSIYQQGKNEQEVVENISVLEAQEEVLKNAQSFLTKSKDYLHSNLKKKIESVFTEVALPQEKPSIIKRVSELGLTTLIALGASIATIPLLCLYDPESSIKIINSGAITALVVLGTHFYVSYEKPREKLAPIQVEPIAVQPFEGNFQSLEEVKEVLLSFKSAFQKMTNPFFLQRQDAKEIFLKLSDSYLRTTIQIGAYRNQLFQENRNKILDGKSRIAQSDQDVIEESNNVIVKQFANLALPVEKLQDAARQAIFGKEVHLG